MKNCTNCLENYYGKTQRIKSEGDYAAVEALVEGYGVKVDQELHAEVLERKQTIYIGTL